MMDHSVPGLRVSHFPSAPSNPYQTLLGRGLGAHGCVSTVINGGVPHLLRYVLSRRGHVLHLHWAHHPVVAPTLLRALVHMVALHLCLVIWRMRGKTLVWTVHNLDNHERKRPRLDRLNSRVIAHLAHRLIVHGQSAVPIVATGYRVPINKLVVVPHGNYDGIVRHRPRDRGHEGTRFLFFGTLQAYKGVPELIKGFYALPGPHQLRITGIVRDGRLDAELRHMSGADERISYTPGFASDADLGELLAWSDVVTLPFREVLTSGSLLMAMTAGRPVLAPRIGVIADHADHAGSFLYDPDDRRGLLSALTRAATASDLDARAEASRARAETYDWSAIGGLLCTVYRHARDGGRA